MAPPCARQHGRPGLPSELQPRDAPPTACTGSTGIVQSTTCFGRSLARSGCSAKKGDALQLADHVVVSVCDCCAELFVSDMLRLDSLYINPPSRGCTEHHERVCTSDLCWYPQVTRRCHRQTEHGLEQGAGVFGVHRRLFAGNSTRISVSMVTFICADRRDNMRHQELMVMWASILACPSCHS